MPEYALSGVPSALLTGTRSADRIRASGHVCRINRPDTWLHPTTLHQRQNNPCQQGAVHTWLRSCSGQMNSNAPNTCCASTSERESDANDGPSAIACTIAKTAHRNLIVPDLLSGNSHGLRVESVPQRRTLTSNRALQRRPAFYHTYLGDFE